MDGANNYTRPGRSAVNPYLALFPSAYGWFVLLASLDIMLTWVVLHFGGEEINALASWILERWSLAGMVVFKFSIVFFVMGSCEIVGRRDPGTGRRLSEWAVAISTVPVIVAFVELLVVVHA